MTYDDARNEEINANELMLEYLNTKDNFLQEIREKADSAAANSPILNGSEESKLIRFSNLMRLVLIEIESFRFRFT
jgi:TATA-binding protein-associated factor Taf7